MALMLDRRQCSILAEMGMRNYLLYRHNEPTVFETALTSTAEPVRAVQHTRTAPQRAAAALPAQQPVKKDSAMHLNAAQHLRYSLCMAYSSARPAGAFNGSSPTTAPWLFICDALDVQINGSVRKENLLLSNMAASVGVRLEQDQMYHSPSMDSTVAGEQHFEQRLAQTSAWLIQELTRIQPCVVVILGRSAAVSLLGADCQMGQLRGRVHQLHALPHIPAVVSYPLDYLLRNPQAKAKAWLDLCLAFSLVAH